jgi:Bacterial Ig domain
VPDPINKGMLYLTTFGSSVWHGPATGVPGAFEDVSPINGLTVALVNPTSGSVFSSGKPVQLIAKVAADTAGMKQVEFFENGISLGMAEPIPTPPGSRTAVFQTQGSYFVLVWSNPSAGTYNLTARLTDRTGAVALSSNVTIVVQ